MAADLRACLLLAAAAAAAPGAAQAQALSDPTRPALAPQVGAAPAPAAQGPVLQSVLISPERRLAVIDGQTVALGGKVGSATLTSVSETEVTLKDETGTRRLRLFPGVEKRAGAAAAAKPAAPAGRGRKEKDKP